MKITRDDDFGGAVLNWAVRYALGRYTYAPGLTIGVIRPMLPDCSTKTVAVLVQDVGEWLERTEPGTPVAKMPSWMSMAEMVKRDTKVMSMLDAERYQEEVHRG